MHMHFLLEALLILFVGFVLLRISGKKTVSEMTGLEIITLLAMASMIGHAVSGDGLWKTILTICTFVALLIAVQFLAVKFDIVEKLFMGKATIVIQDGRILTQNLKKLRMSVDQLEAKLREKGIASFADVKTGTIEMDGQLGYELIRQAKPLTIGDFEKLMPYLLMQAQQKQTENLFDEVIHKGHQKHIPTELQ